MQTVTCKFCNQQVGVEPDYQGKLRLAPHREPDSYIACDSTVKLARESIMTAEDAEIIQSLEQPRKEAETGLKEPETSYEDKIQREFEEFHKNNPHIFEVLINRSFELKDEGHLKYSMSALWDWMRYHKRVQTRVNEPFKINNNYRSRYVRLMIHCYPELENFFELRDIGPRQR